LPLDVSSAEETQRAVSQAAPDHVIHLAGIAFPPEANADPMRTYRVNTLGVTLLMNALAQDAGAALRVLVVGSADQYGPHPGTAYPLRESTPQNPLTPYAGSKAAQEVLALQIARNRKMHVVCTRSFNHSGAGHGPEYLMPSLVARARSLPKRGGTLTMGSGAPVRDYLHVEDAVSAYCLLLERGDSGEIYNVCSGHGSTVRQLAERVLDRLGISATIVEDSALMRPSDVPVLIGDNTKLKRATGWSPMRTIDDIIDDLIHAATD
jgi:GDP-4-dehydro-6-deoxy-D-mannose reductase